MVCAQRNGTMECVHVLEMNSSVQLCGVGKVGENQSQYLTGSTDSTVSNTWSYHTCSLCPLLLDRWGSQNMHYRPPRRARLPARPAPLLQVPPFEGYVMAPADLANRGPCVQPQHRRLSARAVLAEPAALPAAHSTSI